MYGSYGSYSSMCAVQMSAPMDISPSDRSAQPSYNNCAFPSWPRRSSLSDSDHEERASSYLSDEDLFPCDPLDDSDARSVSSAGSLASPTSRSPAAPQQQPELTEAELLEMQRERQAYQREVVRFLLNEKERRRQQMQAARRQRRSGGNGTSNKKPGNSSPSPKTKLNMSTIPE